MSFSDYKIDYNDCLGVGHFATVYAVVKRPDNEKGFASYFFPYIYDYLFRIEERHKVKETDICIKISNSALRVFLGSPGPLTGCRWVSHSFSEANEQKKLNAALQEHGLTRIVFHKTDSYYSQFKTRVYGKTLGYYFRNAIFVARDQFNLRAAFVDFLSKIDRAAHAILIHDMHEDNIMYDERERRWEIIDGYVSTNPAGIDPIGRLYVESYILFKSHAIVSVFEALEKIARKSGNYTEEMDAQLMDAIDPAVQNVA